MTDALRFMSPLASGPIAREREAELMRQVTGAMSFAGKTRVDFARAIGVHPNQVRVLFGDSAKLAAGTREQMLRKAHAWAEEICRAKTTARGSSKFVPIKSARRMDAAAATCKATRDLCVAYGPPGIGKTDAARHVAEKHNAVYVRIVSDSRKARGLRRAIAGAIKGRGPIVGPVPTATLIDALRACGRMLIIDQAHDLSEEGLRVVMDLFDEAGTPIVLIGTVALARRVSVEGDTLFGQLSSRIGLRVDLLPELSVGGGDEDGARSLQWISADELRAIFETPKLRIHPEALRELSRIANSASGLLRVAAKVFVKAALLAQSRVADGEIATVQADDIAGAVAMVHGQTVDARLPRAQSYREAVTA